MHVLVAYSRPRGKYGRYVFTLMIYFSEPTEKAEIAVIRPQTQTTTQNVYSCDHCGRWHTITTYVTTTTPQMLPQSEHRKDGRLELYRYDNVEPDDWIELTLRDTDLLKYQWTHIPIGWDSVSLKNYWRDPKQDRNWYTFVNERKGAWDTEQNKLIHVQRKQFPGLTQLDRQNRLKEQAMTNEVLYEFSLLAWDEYMQSKTGEMRRPTQCLGLIHKLMSRLSSRNLPDGRAYTLSAVRDREKPA